MKKGLYTGRFQPFHLGHLSVVKQALKKVDFLYIGIGSSQSSHSERNPFTAEEREEIIREALKENEISENRFEIIPIPDIHNNEAWPGYVKTIVPHFDISFVGEEGIVKELFEKHTDIPVQIAKRKRGVSGTETRKMIKENGDWEKFVNPSTAKIIKKIDGSKRLKNPTRSESNRIGELPIV